MTESRPKFLVIRINTQVGMLCSITPALAAIPGWFPGIGAEANIQTRLLTSETFLVCQYGSYVITSWRTFDEYTSD